MHVPCPKCGSKNVEPVRFTWWGGTLGPRLLNHVKCKECGTTYNGKTGKSNLPYIILYNLAIILIVASILVLILI